MLELLHPAAAAAILAGAKAMCKVCSPSCILPLQAVVAAAEAKLSTIGAKAEEFSAESKKLQERAQLAHEEWTRGYQKLK